MVEINYSANIAQEEISNRSAEELEEFIEKNIAEGLADKMREHIDEMSFIEMVWNEEKSQFDISAELVLCSKADIVTNAEVQAQKLAGYGLTETQILDVLKTQLEENKGF